MHFPSIPTHPILKVPGPPPSKFFGTWSNCLKFSQDSIGYTRKLFKDYGSIISLAYGGGTNLYSSWPHCPGTILVYGPNFVQQVTTQHDIYYKHPLSGRLYQRRNESERTDSLKHFGVGLLGVNSETHLQHRKLLMPAFHKQRIDSYRDDIVAITDEVLSAIPLHQVQDIAAVMKFLTLRVVTKTLFGIDTGNDSVGLNKLLQDSLALLGAPNTVLLPFDLPGLPFHQLLNLMGQLNNALRSLIQEKREKQDCNNHDVLSMLIQARDEESNLTLSEDEILGHAHLIFGAGHETSATALTWTLFLLSQHPHVASNLLDELQHELQGDAPTVKQLEHLPLLDQVIQESMRVLPPLPWNGRVTSQPTELGGYRLPTGTEVLVSIYQTHHMPDLYSEPEVFNPRRWETMTRNTFEYNPFSSGPRSCIGAAFAKLEIKIVLAMLLQRYRLQCIPQLTVDRKGVIVMTPKQGMPMQIFQQDRQFSKGVGNIRGNIREMVQLSTA